jgi:hypothetical protein
VTSIVSTKKLERVASSIAKVWGKRPCVFPNALAEPWLDADRLFAALKSRAEIDQINVAAPPVRVMVGGRIVSPTDVAALLPRRAGVRIDAYEKQLRKHIGREPIAIIVDRAERALPAIRARATPLLHALFGRVGYPATGIHSCIYAGTYALTPFGIHMDDAHVLMSCSIGRKAIAFWPRAYFEGRPDLLNPNTKAMLRVNPIDHLADAEILELGPRDLLYWPPSYWHVAVSTPSPGRTENAPPRFHAALSVGIYHRASLAGFCHRAIALPPEPRQNSGFEAFDRLDLDGFAATDDLPTPLSDLWSRARASLAAPNAAKRSFLRSKLRSVTSAGFGPDGDDALSLPARGDRLACADPRALAYVRVGERVIIGANGSVIEIATRPQRAVALLERFSEGEEVTVGDFLSLAPSTRRADLLAFLARSGLAR